MAHNISVTVLPIFYVLFRFFVRALQFFFCALSDLRSSFDIFARSPFFQPNNLPTIFVKSFA